VIAIAEELGVPAGQVAIAWAGTHGFVPIIRPRSPEQVADNLGALSVTPSAEQIGRLDAGEQPELHPKTLDSRQLARHRPGSTEGSSGRSPRANKEKPTLMPSLDFNPSVRAIWLVLLAAASAFALTMGIRQSMGLYLSSLNTATGLGVANISLAFAFGQLWWGLTQPFAGAVADHIGTGRVILVGVVLIVIGNRNYS
jgi:hypothetical protein